MGGCLSETSIHLCARKLLLQCGGDQLLHLSEHMGDLLGVEFEDVCPAGSANACSDPPPGDGDADFVGE